MVDRVLGRIRDEDLPNGPLAIITGFGDLPVQPARLLVDDIYETITELIPNSWGEFAEFRNYLGEIL